jgi:hypothetical protein
VIAGALPARSPNCSTQPHDLLASISDVIILPFTADDDSAYVVATEGCRQVGEPHPAMATRLFLEKTPSLCLN